MSSSPTVPLTDVSSNLQHFITQKAKELKLSIIPKLDVDVIDYLMEYNWPGNVRELQNIVERALIINPNGPISIGDLNIQVKEQKQVKKKIIEEIQSDDLDEVISNHILRILRRTEGKVHGPGGAAEIMGINPSTLRNRIRKLKIDYSKK